MPAGVAFQGNLRAWIAAAKRGASIRPETRELRGTGTFHRFTVPRQSDGTENEARFFEDWRRLNRRGDIGEFHAAKHGQAREQSRTERLLGRATPSSQPRDRTRGRKQSVEDDWPRRYLTIRVCQIRPREGTRGPRLYCGERRGFTTLSASSYLVRATFDGSQPFADSDSGFGETEGIGGRPVLSVCKETIVIGGRLSANSSGTASIR